MRYAVDGVRYGGGGMIESLGGVEELPAFALRGTIRILPFENVASASLYLYQTKTYPGSP